jgi:hypothetical protein
LTDSRCEQNLAIHSGVFATTCRYRRWGCRSDADQFVFLFLQSNVRTESNVGARLISGRGRMYRFESAGQKWIETPWHMPLILLSSGIIFCLSNSGFVGRES